MLGLVVALAHAPAGSIALGIDITALEQLSDVTRRTMIDETATLWRSHGVLLTWITAAPSGEPLSNDVMRVVGDGCRVEALCPAGPIAGVSMRTSLGAVVFLEGSAVPENTLMVSVDEVARTVHAVKWQNRRLTDLPTVTRDHLIGRALGRVLAHELGHYLLASRSHVSDGLMRPQFRADQLVEPSRQGFTLSESLVPMLRFRLAQLAAEQRHAGMMRGHVVNWLAQAGGL